MGIFDGILGLIRGGPTAVAQRIIEYSPYKKQAQAAALTTLGAGFLLDYLPEEDEEEYYEDEYEDEYDYYDDDDLYYTS